MLIPTSDQQKALDEPVLSLLILAPAGCGKTEALALRIDGILRRGQVDNNQKILVVTFSNKARDNVQERIIARIGAASARKFVTVQNLHGLSGRIYVAHSYVLGLDAQATFPDSKWLLAKIRSKVGSAASRKAVSEQLRTVKQQPLDDHEVLKSLDDSNFRAAAQIERERLADNRLTYDDLPRLAEVILGNANVASFYRNHFAAIIVDEFQDLTPQQLRIVQSIGFGKTTYAGDLAQGIYGFTGADPEGVLASIRHEVSVEISFSESHRSSPRVLSTVNALVPWTGGNVLTCARPELWPGGGALAVQGFVSLEAEADWIISAAGSILHKFPTHRIGVITRLNDRMSVIETVAAASGISVHQWRDPLYNLNVARYLKQVLQRIDLGQFAAAADKPAYLHSLGEPLDFQDPETLAELQESYEWASDLIVSGIDVAAIVSRIKTGDADALLSARGVHLLSAHLGKGQQFDWVFAAGLEEGVLPFELAMGSQDGLNEELRVFSVILSRARFGVAVTHSRRNLKWGREQDARPSKFLGPLASLDGRLDAEGFMRSLADGDLG